MVRYLKNMEELQYALQQAGPKLLVVKFFASWCGNCRRIAPEFEKLSGDYPNILLCQVDVDNASILAQQFQIRSVPTFFFYKDQNKIEAFSGADVPKLRGTVDRLC
ncbi:hypothetical protein XENTR_v10001629 [Xenopus tropicalis]|uniref:Thioredoxin n=1 Tax=Xenopus tropicalis TaxID=8364 RepID=A0A803KA02_XENTR|eukprot:XP_002940306.1 PREDICTED: thioredoxin-like [Xenopus tropicalis]